MYTFLFITNNNKSIETKDGKSVPAGPIQIKVIYSKFKEN